MLGIVQNLLGPKANPIGITFGADTLRVAQVMQQRDELRLCAAASREVPLTVRDNPKQRLEFFTTSIKEIIASGGFKGKQAVLGLPSSSLAMMHLRLPPPWTSRSSARPSPSNPPASSPSPLPRR